MNAFEHLEKANDYAREIDATISESGLTQHAEVIRTLATAAQAHAAIAAVTYEDDVTARRHALWFDALR